MLLDILGIFIAFAGVMLLLSLIVSALVQVVQHLLGMRWRNLKVGIQGLLDEVPADWLDKRKLAQRAKKAEVKSPAKAEDDQNVVLDGENAQPPGEDEEPPQLPAPAEVQAGDVLDSVRFFRPSATRRGRLLDTILNPQCTWLKVEQLLPELKKQFQITKTRETKVREMFSDMETYLRTRFARNIRVVNLVLAFLVAFCFQVNTFSLLRDLSTDPELRAKYVTESEKLAHGMRPPSGPGPSYQDVSEEALDELQKRHPDLEPLLEEASGKGADRAAIVAEMDLILSEDAPAKRSEIIEEYEQLLDDAHAKAAGKAVGQIDETTRALARFGIAFWAGKWDFYVGKDGLANLVGVLVTAVFLSFGASFWFEALKKLVSLRDQMKPTAEGDKNDDKQNGGQGKQPDNAASNQ